MSIQVFITGGTIAKSYDAISGEFMFDTDHLIRILDQARSTAIVDIETLMLKDSLEIDDVDREIIYQSVENSPSHKILITHGTDTMVETAQKLSSIEGKTIVLTGAMVPYAFKHTDALFNVGTAFGAVGCLSAGVYLSMNGQIFSWDNVRKDKSAGEFIKLT